MPTASGRKSEVPVGLKPAGWFHRAAWYQRELQATAAFVGRRQAYPLCPVSEQARLDVKFRLRLVSVTATPTEALATQTELQKMGYSPSQIEALRPVPNGTTRWATSGIPSIGCRGWAPAAKGGER